MDRFETFRYRDLLVGGRYAKVSELMQPQLDPTAHISQERAVFDADPLKAIFDSVWLEVNPKHGQGSIGAGEYRVCDRQVHH